MTVDGYWTHSEAPAIMLTQSDCGGTTHSEQRKAGRGTACQSCIEMRRAPYRSL